MPQLKPKLAAAFNRQIQLEFESAYLYLAMANQCSVQTLKGTSHWLRKQWEEETGHATKIIDYVLERGNAVELRTLEAPAVGFDSLTSLFREVLKHEQEVTAAIDELMGLAEDQKDYAARAFLQWFVLEQVEEENSAQEILDTLKIAGDSGASLIMLDRHLGRRE